MTATDPLRDAAKPSPLVVSGPMGAELVDRGVRWRGHGMLTDEDAVRALYVEYLQAGCDVLRTNTFQLNARIYLDVFRDPAHMAHIGAPGLATRHVDLTRKAVQLAREARQQTGRAGVPIAGVIGPLEHCFRPDLSPDHDTARAEHNELAETLVEAGADLLLLSSMNTIHETKAAIEAARLTGLPFWVSFIVGPEGELLSREPLADAVYLARHLGAEAVLVENTPADTAEAALKRIEEGGPAGLIPHLGVYDPPSWKFEFFPRFAETAAWTPARFADLGHGAVHHGARIVGVGFGGGPAHVQALVAVREAAA
ncbi:MAG: homocysteine S-methyltransferase family protein [Chloroflexi bacterium]|nr:homocysteine S-methyltransferase family protein [Chloroflexota bacterium]